MLVEACFRRTLFVLLLAPTRHGDQPDALVESLAQSPGDIVAIQLWHPDVQDGQVRGEGGCRFQGRKSVVRDHYLMAVVSKSGRKQACRIHVVVGDENLQRKPRNRAAWQDWPLWNGGLRSQDRKPHDKLAALAEARAMRLDLARSEERRVGKECRSRWARDK